MTNLYTTSKSKALNFNYRPEKLVNFNRDDKNILKGYSPAALLRESTNIANSFSVRFDETAPSNETRAFNWASALKNEKLVSKLITNDREIEQVTLDLPNQRVVNTDCMRTRVGILDDSMRDSLERLLTFYCKRERITYKQGLNEVAAPFVYFLKAQVRISNIYNYFVLFVDKFLPTSFVDKDFITLQCYFRTLELLLKYHDANFHTFLSINDLPSELYATPWFLTLFASKLTLDMVYFLWDICIFENDPCFKFFIGLALLLENKNLIIGSETPMIPQSLSNLTIKNSTAMKQIYKRAVELRMKTPVSFLGKIRELDLFNKDYQSSEDLKNNMQKNLDYLQSLQCILVSTYELTNALYSNDIFCSDPTCSNYKKLEASERPSSSIYTRAGSFDVLKPDSDKKPKKVMTPKNLSYYEQKDPRKEVLSKGLKSQCLLCQMENSSNGNLTVMSHLKELVNYKQALKLESRVEPAIDFFIIDLRQSRNGGSLPASQKVSFSKALEETINLLINDFIEMQTKYHFVFMISNFNSWVFKDLVESKDIKTRRGISEALKSERGFRGGNVSVEDEWLMAFLDAFIQNGFPYLSILEGGYEEVNRNLHNLNLTPLNHNADYCQVCHPTEAKSPSFFNLINKVIDKTGETLGMIVDGIGSNALDSGRTKRKIDVSERLDTSITKTASQGLFNFNSPKMSGVTPEKHKIPIDDTRLSSDYLLGSSPYKSQASSMQSLESLANGLTKYLQDDHPNQLHAGDTDYLEENNSGRITAPGKIMTSSSVYNTSSQTSLAKGGYTTGSQPSLQKISIPIYTNPSSQGNKTSMLATKSTFAPYSRTNIGNTAANKSEMHRQMSKERKTEPNQELLLSHTQFTHNESEFVNNTTIHTIGFNSLQNQNLSLSRIVSEPIKKQTDEFDANVEYIDLTVRKMTHQDRKNTSSMNTPSKFRNEKAVTYSSNYVSPALNNMFKPVKQVERDHRSGIYDHESGIKPFDLDIKQESDKSEKSYKEASIYDTLATDPIHDHKNKSAYLYNNMSGTNISITVPTKQGDYGSPSSGSKKINIAQLLKEPTFTTAGTRSPITAYPVISSQDSHQNYDYLGRSSVQPDKSLHLDTFGADMTSNREISSLRTITQSPSPKKIRGREVIDMRRTTDTVDNLSSFPSYTDPVSPVSRTLISNTYIRDESEANRGSESSYYERNGIFKEFKLSQSGIFWLYKTFENVEFSLYACNYVKEAVKEDGSYAKYISDANKRIILTSKDFLVALQFRQEIMEDLQLLQVGVTVDRILKRSRGKSHDKGFHSVYGTADSSPKTYEAVVQAIFPIKLLLRITSKKADAKFLSFYFKLPSLEKVLSMNASKFFNFSEINIQELPDLMKKEGYMRMIRELCDSKDLSTCVQSKSVYCFDSSFNAQECIKKTKEAYGSASSYLHEKLKKPTKY